MGGAEYRCRGRCAVPGAVRRAGQAARRRGMAAAELQELRALVERAGGRRAVLLVAEVAEGVPAAATLAAFARDLLGDESPPGPGPGPVPGSGCRSRRRAGGGRRALAARLLLVLCRGGAARGRGARTRLREVVRDVRGRLPPAPPPAVVGVLLPGGDGEDAAVLDATLRRHFPASGTVQAARYSPGSPAALRDCRAAACRALRAALQHPAGTGGEGTRTGRDRGGGQRMAGQRYSLTRGLWALAMGFAPFASGIFLSLVGSTPSQWDLTSSDGTSPPHPNGMFFPIGI